MGNFTENTLITFITRIMTAIFGILITVIIARVLGPQGQGIYSLAILLPITLLTFTVFGINTSSVFYIGKKKYVPEEIFSNNIFFTIFLSISTFLIGLIIIFFFSDKLFPGVEKIYLFLALGLIPFNLFFELISSILLGLQEIKKYNFISFFQSFLFLFLVAVLLLGLKFGVMMIIFAQIFSFIIAGIILFFVVRKEIGTFILKLNKNYIKDAFNYGVKNYLGDVLNFLHYRIDQLLINVFINPVAVGFYYVAARLAEGIWPISQSAATVLFPRIAAETNEKRLKEFTPLVCRNVLFITFLIAFLLFISSFWIITLFYSEKFLDSIRPFQILLIGTSFIAGWRILASDISARGRPMINIYPVGLSVALNIILNIIFIPIFGIVGAAFTTAISYFIMFLITIFIYTKISGNKIMDVVFIRKSDLLLYKNVLIFIKRKIKEI